MVGIGSVQLCTQQLIDILIFVSYHKYARLIICGKVNYFLLVYTFPCAGVIFKGPPCKQISTVTFHKEGTKLCFCHPRSHPRIQKLKQVRDRPSAIDAIGYSRCESNAPWNKVRGIDICLFRQWAPDGDRVTTSHRAWHMFFSTA